MEKDILEVLNNYIDKLHLKTFSKENVTNQLPTLGEGGWYNKLKSIINNPYTLD